MSYPFVMTKPTDGVEGRGKATAARTSPRATVALPPERRCAWCRQGLREAKATGRPRRYCSAACRQWDWVTRRGDRAVQITEKQLVLARAEVDRLHDAVYVLACAIADTESDLESLGVDASAAELRSIVDWLLTNARPLAGLRLAPS